MSLDSRVAGLPYESSSFATSAVRWGGKRKAPLNFSFPLEGKCHVVAKGCTRVNIPMKLTIVLLDLTSPHLEVLCRTSTGDYKAPLCCELLMKGLLFRALFCPLNRGEVRRSRIGGGERSEPVSRMLIIPYDIESQSRNADFISIAREGNPQPSAPQALSPPERSEHNPPPSGGHNLRPEGPSTFPSEPFEP